MKMKAVVSPRACCHLQGHWASKTFSLPSEELTFALVSFATNKKILYLQLNLLMPLKCIFSSS